MDTDWIMIGIVIAAILYFSGYAALGTVVGLLLFLVFTASVVFERKPQRTGSSASVLEPIVIESTRGLPYRIPGEINIKYDRKMSEGTQWEKRPKKWGKAIGSLIGVARGDEQEEKK